MSEPEKPGPVRLMAVPASRGTALKGSVVCEFWPEKANTRQPPMDALRNSPWLLVNVGRSYFTKLAKVSSEVVVEAG